MSLDGTARTLLLVLALSGCGANQDAAMWECQLSAQKANAGKSAAAAAERALAIAACMEQRGYRLDQTRPSCLAGSVQSTCYRPAT